jgi:hypothetical protein
LVWGTNDEKGGPNCKPVDAGIGRQAAWDVQMEELFRDHQPNRQHSPEQDPRLEDERSLHIRIKNLGGSRVEISCIGEGKEVRLIRPLPIFLSTCIFPHLRLRQTSSFIIIDRAI